jgi:TusE/DsrC/DsvC family sulfur relay protein
MKRRVEMRDLLSEVLNEKGFLNEPAQWNEEVALEVARREGMEGLDDMHWRIIRYLRDYYQKCDFLPTLRRACKVSGEWRNSCLSCFFRNDPLKAVKIAGLPEPGDDIKAYYHGACKCKRPSSSTFQQTT